MEKKEELLPLFTAATGEMKPGEVHFSDGFDLYHCLSCLEVNDARTDPCIDISHITTLEDLKERNAVPSVDITHMPMVLDELLRLLMSYWKGQPLIKTVGQCIFMYDEEATSNPILRVFIRGIHAIVACTRFVIVESQVVFEEDFSYSIHGLEPPHPVEAAQVYGELEEVSALLLQQAALAKGKAVDVAPISTTLAAKDQAILCQQLRRRVEILQSFLSILQCCIAGSMKDIVRMSKVCRAVGDALRYIRKGHEAVPEEAAKIFQGELYKLLGRAGNPRPATLLSFPEAMDYAERILAGCGDILSLANAVEHTARGKTDTNLPFSFIDLIRLLLERGKQELPTLVRAITMYATLRIRVEESGAYKGTLLCQYDMVSLVQSSFLPLGIPIQLAAGPLADCGPIQGFIIDLATALVHLYGNCLFTPSRQRRRIATFLSNSTPVLQAASGAGRSVEVLLREKYAFLRSAPTPMLFVDVVMLLYCVCIQHIFDIGFFLDIYDPLEMPMLLWYSEYICMMQCTYMKRVSVEGDRLARLLDACTERQQLLEEAKNPRNKRSGKKGLLDMVRKKITLPEPQTYVPSLAYDILQARINTTHCIITLLHGMHAYTGEDPWKDPSLFNSIQQRFEARFSFLRLLLGNSHVRYPQFVQNVQSAYGTIEQGAEFFLGKAKARVEIVKADLRRVGERLQAGSSEWARRELEGMEKCCKDNGLWVLIVEKSLRNAGSGSDKRVHYTFPPATPYHVTMKLAAK